MIGYGLDLAMDFIIMAFRIYFRAMRAIVSFFLATKDRQQGWNGKGDES